MKRHVVGFITLMVCGFLLSVLAGRAADSVSLSAEDEQVYQDAYSSWKTFAEANKKIGIPPPEEDPPERFDFIGAAAERVAAA